jgi:hypothetical protein
MVTAIDIIKKIIASEKALYYALCAFNVTGNESVQLFLKYFVEFAPKFSAGPLDKNRCFEYLADSSLFEFILSRCKCAGKGFCVTDLEEYYDRVLKNCHNDAQSEDIEFIKMQCVGRGEPVNKKRKLAY